MTDYLDKEDEDFELPFYDGDEPEYGYALEEEEEEEEVEKHYLNKEHLCRYARYGHDLDKIEHACLSAVEQNIFFYVCARVRDQGTTKVVISYDAIRANAAFVRHGDAALEAAIHGLYEKMRSFDYVSIRLPKKWISGVLFTVFETDREARTLTVSVNEVLMHLLNDLQKNFTLLPLGYFVSLKGKHAKCLYRELCKWRKQHRSTTYSPERLAEILGLSAGGRLLTTRVTEALKPAVWECGQYFGNLVMHTTTEGSRGRRVKGIYFTWDYSPDGCRRLREEAKTREERLNFLMADGYVPKLRYDACDTAEVTGPLMNTVGLYSDFTPSGDLVIDVLNGLGITRPVPEYKAVMQELLRDSREESFWDDCLQYLPESSALHKRLGRLSQDDWSSIKSAVKKVNIAWYLW